MHNTYISGLQNFSFSQDSSIKPFNVVGKGKPGRTFDAPVIPTFAVDKIMCEKDIITNMISQRVLQTGIMGQFIFGTKRMNYDKTLLNDYSIAASINQIPQISANFSIYGSVLGSNNLLAPGYENPLDPLGATISGEGNIKNISQTGIKVTFTHMRSSGIGSFAGTGNEQTNTMPVQSFTYSQNFNYNVHYEIGNSANSVTDGTSITPIGPDTQRIEISVEVDDAFGEDGLAFGNITEHTQLYKISGSGGQMGRDRDVKMEIFDESGNATYTFQLENGYYISESISNGVGDSVVLNLTYGGTKPESSYT
jgi:hypothetical protein